MIYFTELEREAALKAAAPDLLEACQRIVDLSAGWNKNGSTGPRHPLSWESVGRVAMDYARYALSKIEEG
jgi:hypothetical protein